MFWCEHCGGRVSTRLDGNCFICCYNCGKVLLDLHEPTFVKDPQKSNKGSRSKPAANAPTAETFAAADQQVIFIKRHIPGTEKIPKPLTHEGDATGQSSVTIGASTNQT